MPNQVIVRYRADAAEASRTAALDSVRGRRLRSLGISGLDLVTLPDGADVDAAVRELSASPGVAYAQPNHRYEISGSPNDTYFGSQWGLHNIGQPVGNRLGSNDADVDAPEAWDRLTGDDITVAVVDTGVDAGHPDLAPNVWTNPGETGTDSQGRNRASNGVDDDGNGLKDDWRGWDFVYWDNNPSDPHGHGTHVAGTIAAVGNNGRGVSGVAWQARIVPLRVLDSWGSGSDADIAAAFAYAGRMGFKVVNASLGGGAPSTAMRDAIEAYPNTLFVFAAGNNGSLNNPYPSWSSTYPCAYPSSNIVCVAATDSRDERAYFSNYGAQTVDLGAPGDNILSTLPGGEYGYMSGTSMASPHVAGAAALAYAHRPEATVAQVRQALLTGADPIPSMHNLTASGARLNLVGALGEIAALVPSDIAVVPPGGLQDPVDVLFTKDVRGVTTANVTWRVASSASSVAPALVCRDGGGDTTSCLTGTVRKATLAPPSNLLPGQWYTVTVSPPGVPPVTDTDGVPLATASRTFRAAKTVQEPGPSTSYVWRAVAASGAYGGSYVSGRLNGTTASWTGVGDSITWITVKGPDQGVASVYIDDVFRGTFNLYAPKRQLRTGYAFRYLAPGTAHTIKIVVHGSKGASNAADTQVSVDALWAGDGPRHDHPNLDVVWQGIDAASASAGRYVRATLAGGGAWFTFRGTGADWYTVAGPGMGLAAIYVDGRYVRTVDSYAASLRYGIAWSVRGLTDTVHTLRVVPLGRKRSASTGTVVAIDKFSAV